MEEIVGKAYEVEVRNVSHTRSLTITNGVYELGIHPEGGISHGWGIENGRFRDYTVDIIGRYVDANILCFNQLSHDMDNKGIPYFVEFRPILKKDS
jgi:hypothetical protein